jgi:hypothetical protein
MGKEYLPFEWNGINLEQLRKVMDEPADKAVAAVYQSASLDYLRTLLRGMAENDSIVPKSLPVAMRDFIKKELEFKFSPYDIELFNKTHEIWKEKGTRFIFILFFRALPYTYMAEKPANVLRITKLLESHTERRVFETAQFVFDVMDNKWWKPNKRGILTALKVRIMHAAMRHIILDPEKQGEKWNESWGMPISQEDLVATNQVFSLEFFKGLEMLGDELTPEEQKAWFHTWKTIGRIMGVQDQLLSSTVEEAWTLQHAIYDHLFRDETHSGVALAKALAETLHHFHMPKRLILLIMRRMLADEQFPDCFDRMLGPSYRDEYPELFMVHETSSEKEKHEELLRNHYHIHLREYYHTIRDKRPEYNNANQNKGFIRSIYTWVQKFLGRTSQKRHLIDLHIGNLHNILHHKENETPVEKLEEDMIVDSMTHLSGLMIGLLSFHFRKGKESGFRIPASLKEHWQLHG